jgi:hypothetical protein
MASRLVISRRVIVDVRVRCRNFKSPHPVLKRREVFPKTALVFIIDDALLPRKFDNTTAEVLPERAAILNCMMFYKYRNLPGSQW